MKLLLSIILNAICFTICDEIQVLKIGAIFFPDETDSMYAFDTAIDDINKLELDVRLEAVKHFLSMDDSIDLQYLTCDLIGNGVVAIFGPSSQAKSNIVEVLCNITGIPHLQFDWHGPDTARHKVNHQMTVNLAPSESLLSSAYADILRNKAFDWKSFTIIYESSSDLARMQHIFAWKKLQKTGIKIREFRRGDDYRILWKYVSSTKEKFVLLDCPSDILTEVVNASIFYNMTGPFNNLFLVNLDTHLSGLEKLYSKDFSATTTAIRLRTYQPPLMHHEFDVFEDEEVDKINSVKAQLIYDAVILYFNAIRYIIRALRFYEPQLRCGGGFWKPGPEVIEVMKWLTPKNVTPPYKTQKLHLNELGERDDFNLEIYNPLVDRISHVWNKNHYLVSYDELTENSTKKAQKRKQDEKEDFSQKRLRYTVATRVGEPYFMWREEPEGVHYEGNERFEGYAVDLIYKLAEECKFDFDFNPVPDNKYGSYDPLTDEWDGIIRQLMDNNAQIGICDLTITQARRSVVDFTVPFMQLGISILYYKNPPPPTDLFAFLNPYALEVWMYLLVALMVNALILVIVARISEPEWEIQPSKEENVVVVKNIWYLINNLWLLIGSIVCAGCDLLPRGLSMRLYTTFWWIFALLLSQTYTAQLAAFITAKQLKGAITNLHDLVDQNKVQFGTVKGGSTSLFFSESNESDYRVAWNKMIALKPDAFTVSNKEGVDRVKRSAGRYAFLMETTSLQYYTQRNCDLMQIGEPFGEKHYGIAVPLNAPFRSNLSVGILKLSERGELYSLKSKWFNFNGSKCEVQGDQSNDQEQKPFDMVSVGGLFIVLGAGVAIGTLIGICEFVWYAERISVKQKVPLRLALKSEFMFFIRFWLQRKPSQALLYGGSSSTAGYSSFERSSSTPSVKKKKKKSKKKEAKS